MRAIGLGLMLVALAPGAAQAATIDLAARDALTGAAVTATVELTDRDGKHTLHIDGAARSVAGPDRSVPAIARADGYHPLRFRLDPGVERMRLLLDPLAAPPAFRRLAAPADPGSDVGWLQGYIRHADDGAGLAGATVSAAGQTVLTDADGYFELSLGPVASADITRYSVAVAAADSRRHRVDGLLRHAGIQRLVVALGADPAAVTPVVIGALDRREGTLAAPGGAALMHPRPASPAGPLVAPGLTPPASIRVGYADAACTQPCCTASCTTTCTMSLETYVRRGLDNEWIASWNTQALRAGSLAYRSYGAWRVDHPIRAAFDICSSACCQVNDASTASSTDAAIARTPGMLLTRDGDTAAGSEYSAENNSWDDPNDGLACSNVDLSCGNGYAGSPAAGWPCLDDPVGTNRGCFGHGRGMSQWGTQRWAIDASARRWPWIVDHYYNAHGSGSALRTAIISSPLGITGIATQPAAAAPGSVLQILAEADNAAGAAHARLLVGASLYRAGVGYVDDPGNDAPLSLAPGAHPIGRPFRIPAGTPPGQYDLLVSLYLDVDENGTITSADLPLALARVTSALQVTDERIFADGFET